MSEAYRLGGWGMIPTTIAGFILVMCAWRFALRPSRDRLPVVLWLGALVGLTSTLGFVTGVIKSFIASGQLSPNDALGAVIIGTGESAVNLGLGLALCIIATIGVIVGHARRPAAGAQLVDPL